MRVRKVIKTFKFENQYRSLITFDSGVRLHPSENRLMLQEDSNGEYPLTENLEGRTWIANPGGCRQWLGFESYFQNAEDETGAEVTSVEFRLSDGTDDYWWDGSSWDDAPVAGEWNTESEIAAHISTFPSVDKKIQVIVNPKTTNEKYSPRVELIKVLYASDADEYEDIIYRTLVRQMREGIRPIGRMVVTMPATGTTFSLEDVGVDFTDFQPYKVVDVDSVFNHDVDPDHAADLLSAYNDVTHLVTLTGSVDQGTKIWLRLIYEPLVAVQTSKDFEEVDRVPAIVFSAIRTEEAGNGMSVDDWVVNKSDGSAVKVPAPVRGDLEVELKLVSDSGIDQVRFVSEVTRWFEDNPLINSLGFDEKYRLWLIEEYSSLPSPNMGDLHSGRLLFRVKGVRYPGKASVDSYAVQKVQLTGDADIEIE